MPAPSNPPPSFASFPDLEFAPSTSKETTTEYRSGGGKRNRGKKPSSSHKAKRGDDSERLQGKRNNKETYDLYGPYGGDLKDHDEVGHFGTTKGVDLASTSGGMPVFYSDRKGDPLNITYGGLHSYAIPKYRVVNRRKILGLPAWTAVHRSQHEIAVAPNGQRKMPGLTDPSSRHLLAAPPKRTLNAQSKGGHKYNEVDGFLRITHRRPIRTSEPSYRSITGDPALDSDAYSSSSESEGDSTDYGSDTTPTTSLQAKLKSLEERLATDPSSVPAWLSLLSHTLSAVPTSSRNSARARADIAVAILSHAIAAHPNNAKSRKLRLKYIRIGEEIWPEHRLHEEWERALGVEGVDIWLDWLDWRIRSTSYGLDNVVESAVRVLAVYNQVGSELGQIRAFWRVAIAFRDAGYTERAMALFQAQAELSFQTPSGISEGKFADKLDGLEDYWESEVLRVGEVGAMGWARWEEFDRPGGPVSSSQRIAERPPTPRDSFSRWASNEMSADRSCVFPARSSEVADDGDPYATIIFSDIRPFLLDLRSSTARNAFRLTWLSFLGLHIPGLLRCLTPCPADTADDRWACSHYASPAYLTSIFPSARSWPSKMTSDSSVGVLIGREKEYVSSFGPIQSWGHEVWGPFDRVGDGRQCSMWGEEDVANVHADVVREVFKSCRLGRDDSEWDVLNVAFEATLEPKQALKISKALLATSGDSIPQWAAHARIERNRGRMGAARKIYQTVLSSVAPELRGGSTLWWDWAEMEWLSGGTDAALDVICRCTGTESGSGIATLRSKRFLEDSARQTPAARWKEGEGWVKLRVLLELLTSTVGAALAYMDEEVKGLERGTSRHESLVVASLVLVYTHGVVLKQPTAPGLLRERAQRAVVDYPNNTIILGLFLEGEKGQGVWGRVREILGEGGTGAEKGGEEKGVARRVAEVWMARWEVSRWEGEGERTRSGLMASVGDERTRGSATLWRVNLEFEIRRGELGRAKELLFRVVRECPLVKEFYLLAFGPLRSVFTERELQEWGEAMMERGLRLRRGLEDVMEEWGREAGREGGGQTVVEAELAEEDEIEHDARELRRLRPY